MKHAFLIAAPTSGSGKTTIARGLMALLVEKGYKVQPFKCGPDYIDTKFHAEVCGRPSVNLDTFMATPEHVRELFAYYGAPDDPAYSCYVYGPMDDDSATFFWFYRDKEETPHSTNVCTVATVASLEVALVRKLMEDVGEQFRHKLVLVDLDSFAIDVVSI